MESLEAPDAAPRPEPIPDEAVEAEPIVPTDDVVVPPDDPDAVPAEDQPQGASASGPSPREYAHPSKATGGLAEAG